VLGPLAGLAVLVAVLFALDPLGPFRPITPLERLAFERTVFDPGIIELHVRNDGAGDVVIAQVLVNDAYWTHEVGDRSLRRLESTVIHIPYPWEEGLPLDIALVMSSGATVRHEIEAAVPTPRPDAANFRTYTLVGLFVGVFPVALGLFWVAPLRRAGPSAGAFVLALTVGLLAILLIETTSEGLTLAAEAPASLDGVTLFGLGALATIALLALPGSRSARRPHAAVVASGVAAGSPSPGAIGHRTAQPGPLTLAYLIAVGIGLHNLGEGLGIGTALAVGDVALGTSLVVAFMAHNVTEGLAIVAPLGAAGSRPAIGHLALLAAVAGAPAIPGTWLGGYAHSPTWSALALGVAAGAIVQVLLVVGRTVIERGRRHPGAAAAGFVAGLAVMYLAGVLTP
jgi:zinc transporter ZupT